MRDQALVHADLQPTHTAIDIGAGTGFTSLGVISQVKIDAGGAVITHRHALFCAGNADG
jgi:hypothetical protein